MRVVKWGDHVSQRGKSSFTINLFTALQERSKPALTGGVVRNYLKFALHV